MSEYDRNEARSDGNTPVAPGIGYSGQPQRQRQGLVGRAARNMAARFSHLFRGKTPGNCGPIANEDCADVANRFLEETFRNFRLHANTPPWQEPPWTALPFDKFPAPAIAINQGPFVTIASVTAPLNGVAVVRRVGQFCDTAAAFGDVQWRFMKGGLPYGNYQPILTGIQYFGFTPPDLLPAPVILVNGEQFAIEATGTLPLARFVNARIWGWSFQPRTNLGLDPGTAIAD